MNPERTYYKNGRINTERWRNDIGEYHRLDGPARREWYDSGQLKREVWAVNDRFHRFDGPAYRLWHENGQQGGEVWYIDGIRHRLDGPAWQVWRENGRLLDEAWYINGVKYKTKDEFQVAVDLYKANEIAELF